MDLNILANLIQDWMAKQPDLDLLTFVDIDADGNFVDETRTYSQLWSNGQKLAAWMRGKGMQKGDTFGMVMANHPEFVDLMVASSILGTIFVPIDPRTKGDKLRYMLDFAGCKGSFVAEYALDNVRQVWEGQERWILPVGSGPGTTGEVLAGPLPEPLLEVQSKDSREPMQLLYTSGTTGDPKAIMTAHNRITAARGIGALIGLTAEDRPYTGLSLTHANAQIITLGCILSMGLRGVISRRFTKSRLWDITRAYGCTTFNLLGGMTNAIYAEPRKENDADNPVRIILSAGMPANIWEDFAKRFDVQIYEFYGAAEGGLTANPPGVGPIGSCGKPMPGTEMKILDDDGNECPPGEPGEICFRPQQGPAPEVQYLKNEEASEEKTRGGWLRMGDIGHVDEEGWLFFHYRKGGGIRRNGDFINTTFIEKALAQQDVIDDVYVYGVPLPGMAPGEKEVVAAIVLNPSAHFDAEAVFEACRDQLEAAFIPGFLQVLKEIPKTASEKPQDRFLLDDFAVDAPHVHARQR